MAFTKLNDNIFLFIDESYFDVVVGAIILPSKIVIIDSGISNEKQKEFREYVEKETGKKCEFLLLTHYHGDHIGGIQSYSDCKIVVSKPAYEILKDNENLPILYGKDFFEIVDDDIKVIFKRTGGHSSDSAYIYCPNYKVLFAGDNLFENMYPYGQDKSSDPDVWISAFEEYLNFDVDYYIPGHQNICNQQIIKQYIEFIKSLKILILKLHSEGKSRDAIIEHCFNLNPFPHTEIYVKLRSLRLATLERWYNLWVK